MASSGDVSEEEIADLAWVLRAVLGKLFATDGDVVARGRGFRCQEWTGGCSAGPLLIWLAE